MTDAIKISNLQKTFGRGNHQVNVIKHIDLTVEAGQVFGFLGPNGAGKSTTIRMILNLIRPTRGDIQLYGLSIQSAQAVLKSRVGAMVDGARFYPFLSGRGNLEVVAKSGGVYCPSQIDTLLEQLGMTDRADRLMQSYSTGMKQRIGIAATLLGNPDLIILDEPTNGLDPKGIREIRQFIRDLVDKHGKTVFLSSHLLNEIEQICDRVAIVNHGEIVQEGAVSDLLAGQIALNIETDQPQMACDILSNHWQTQQSDDRPDWLTIQANRDDTPHILRQLMSADISVYQVLTQRRTLEDYFLAVTDTDHNKEVAHA